MSVILNQTPQLAKTEMRIAYNDTMMEIAQKDDKVVLLEADLMGAIKTNGFMNAFNDRFVNLGIMEANMMGVAAGMSVTGLKPYIHTFGPFATRRAYDQVFLSLGYAHLNAKIIGSDAGVSASHNGGTHMPFEDLGLMNLVPNATVLEMSDHVMFQDILKQVNDLYGLYYIRIVRKNMIQLYEEGSTFEIGKGIVLKDGTDVTLVATGIMIAEALEAAEKLEAEGISTAVIDMFTIKPIDKDLLVEYAQKTKLMVTCDNHNVIGGLGSMVLGALEEVPVKVRRVGVQNRFGQVGPQDFLQKEYGLTSDDIVKAAKEGLQ